MPAAQKILIYFIPSSLELAWLKPFADFVEVAGVAEAGVFGELEGLTWFGNVFFVVKEQALHSLNASFNEAFRFRNKLGGQ